MTRLLEPAYEDGVSEPRGGRFNNRLPNARVISQIVNEYRNVSAPNFTMMLMQIGQFLDHDIALAPMEEDPGEIVNLGSKDPFNYYSRSSFIFSLYWERFQVAPC